MASEFWTASCILMVLGVALAAIGTLLKYYGEQQERYPGRAEARVVDIVTEPRTGDASLSEFRNRQVAVFEFYAGGKLIKVTDPADTYPCPYFLHQKVKICYDPVKPEHFQLIGKNSWRLSGRCVHLLGILDMAAGCILFLMHAARIEF